MSNTKNVILTAVLTSILTTVVTYFGIDLLKKKPWGKSKTVEVPLILGLSQAEAEAVLRAQDLKLSIIESRPNQAFPAGTICVQAPVRGDRVPKGSVITAVLSAGIPTVKVPSVVGKDITQATALIAKAGLALGKVQRKTHPTIPKDRVIASQPLPGKELRRGAKVDLVVSQGQDLGEVPKVRGRYLKTAKRKIIEAGFVVGTIKWRDSDDYDDYQVIRQKPDPGTKAPKGSPIDLVVNRGD